MAEAVFRSMCPVEYDVDSAGTASYHIGKSPDKRTIQTLSKNGISTSHRAQQLNTGHFSSCDYIVCMDDQNYNDALRLKPAECRAKRKSGFVI